MVVGIDVAKADLVVATRPVAERWMVANDEAGVRALVDRLRVRAPELIVLERRVGMNCSASRLSPRRLCPWSS